MQQATIEDLYRVEGKAEIIDGEIIQYMPTGRMPAFAAGEIFVSLRLYIRATRSGGVAVPDNAGFRVDLPHRGSFSPDAAYYEGSDSGMRFFEGPPLFAAEVRSENDYGVVAEQDMAEKRADYFAAGTLVVWDVDLLGDEVVRKYAAPDSRIPVAVYRRGEVADAEPAVPGWTLPINELFEQP